MFFGLTNSPAIFQTMMNSIFADDIAEKWLTWLFIPNTDQMKPKNNTYNAIAPTSNVY